MIYSRLFLVSQSLGRSDKDHDGWHNAQLKDKCAEIALRSLCSRNVEVVVHDPASDMQRRVLIHL